MNSAKYNRTLHLPFSLGATSDDKIASDVAPLLNKNIVITEKMDGSNTSLETDGCFARSHSGPPNHPSFDGLKALHAKVKSEIPSNIQIFGEWCFAEHSIKYEELPGYFMLFNVRDTEKKIWESWSMVELWASVIDCPTVPVLWRGVLRSEKEMQNLSDSLMNQKSKCGGDLEGFVIRNAEEFSDDSFSDNVMKMVRANHVTTDQHWKEKQIVRNKLK